jgi:hypothetical protein
MSMQPPPRAPVASPVPARNYGPLRTLAGACIFSAWLTLVLSVLIGLGMLVAPTPSAMPGLPPSYPGGDGGELGLPTNPGAGQLGPLLGFLLPGLKMIGVVTTIGGGVLSFFFLAALGYGVHLLLDMEENTRITAHALAQIARRQGT